MRPGYFSKVFGETPRNIMLEYFLEGREIEHAISDIAEELALNRTTAYSVAETLLSENIIEPTRKIGNTQLYKLAAEHPRVKALTAAFDAILRKAPELEAIATN